MMLHTKSPRQRYLKLLALLPIVAVALAVNAETETHYVYTQPQQQTPVKKGAKAGTIKMGSKSIKVVKADAQSKADASAAQTSKSRPFDVVEQMPEYPGGPAELFKFLTKNVKYPAEAEKAGIQGRVILTFVVEKDGTISEPTVVKSVDPVLDAEAVRVISAMPNWVPGRQNGEVVRVKYAVPVTFALQKASSTPQTVEKGKDEAANGINELVVGYENETVQGLWTPGENAPCVIIDGKTVDGAKLKDIDPKTIESMDIIKGKSAVEKYGDKAKRGAIFIITKKK